MIFARLTFLGLLFFAVCASATADVIVLENGDRITGTVVNKVGAHIRFKTSEGDVVRYPWDTVRSLKCESTIILGRDGRLLRGGVVISREAKDAIDGEEGVTWINASAVKMINPDPWRVDEGWHNSGRFNLALVSERGNTDKDEVDADVTLVLRHKKDRVTLRGELENDAEDKIETQSKWVTDGMYDHFVSKKMYSSVGYSARADKFANVDLRTTIGAGVGYELIDSVKTKFLMEGMLAYLWEDAVDEANDQYWAAAVHIDLERVLKRDRLIFFCVGSGTFSLEEGGKHLLEYTTGFRAPLWSGVVFTAEVSADFDSKPVGDAEKYDNTYRLKVGYQW